MSLTPHADQIQVDLDCDSLGLSEGEMLFQTLVAAIIYSLL